MSNEVTETRVQFKSTRSTASDLTQINFLVLGASGSGKSVFATSFPTPAFVFDFDRQIAVYRNTDFEYEQFDNTLTGAKKYKEVLKTVCKDKHFKSVIFDSLTTLQDLMMTLALGTYLKRTDETNLPLWQSHYPMCRAYMDADLNLLRSRPGYNLATGHIETIKDEITGQMRVQPSLVGKLATGITKYFGECYQTKRSLDKENKPKFMLLTRSSGIYDARSNLSGKEGKIPQLVENDFNIIMNYLKI